MITSGVKMPVERMDLDREGKAFQLFPECMPFFKHGFAPYTDKNGRDAY